MKRARSGAEDNSSIVLDFDCPICLNLIDDVRVSECGHLFCERCICQLRPVDEQFPCPLCRTVTEWSRDARVPNGYRQCAYIQRLIDEVPVVCTGVGCLVRVHTRELPEHLVTCAFAPIPCQHCALRFPRSTLPTHESTCPCRRHWCTDCRTGYLFRDYAAHRAGDGECIRQQMEVVETAFLKMRNRFQGLTGKAAHDMLQSWHSEMRRLTR
jgi:hypothetical protein